MRGPSQWDLGRENWGQEQHPRAARLNERLGPFALVESDTVEDDDVVLLQGWRQLRFHPEFEITPVQGAIDNPGGSKSE